MERKGNIMPSSNGKQRSRIIMPGQQQATPFELMEEQVEALILAVNGHHEIIKGLTEHLNMARTIVMDLDRRVKLLEAELDIKNG